MISKKHLHSKLLLASLLALLVLPFNLSFAAEDMTNTVYYHDESIKNLEQQDNTGVTQNFIFNADYRYYDSKRSYNYYGVGATYTRDNYLFSLNYEDYYKLNKTYKNLQSASFLAAYSDEYISLGGILASQSDKLFSSNDSIMGLGYAGFNVMKLFNTSFASEYNGTDSHAMKFYLGVGGTNRFDFMGSYVLPYFAFYFENQYVSVNIGYPLTSIVITPHEKHSLTFVGLIDFGYIGYDFSPIPGTVLNISYERTDDAYVIDGMPQSSSKKKREMLHYQKYWIQGGVTQHLNDHIILNANIGYQHLGYSYYGKELERAHSRRLPYTTKYEFSINAIF